MGNKRITTTDRSGLSLAQVGGNDIYKMRHQVQSVIELGQLGDDYVLLFSEPVENGRSIDWYAEGAENSVRAIDLPPEERSQVLGRFREMLVTLQEYAQKLRQQNRSQTYRNYADIMEKALTLPGIESVYAVNGRPVLVNWGLSQGDNSLVEDTKKLIKEIDDKIGSMIQPISREQKTQPESASTDMPVSAPVDASKQSKSETTSNPLITTQKTQPVSASTDMPVSAPVDASKQSESETTPNPLIATQSASLRAASSSSASSRSWLLAMLAGAGIVLAGVAAAWYFLMYKPKVEETKQEAPLAWLKGNHYAKGMLVNENNEAVDLTLSFSGDDGKGKSYIIEKNQTCEGNVIASPQGDNSVFLAISELKCPNSNHYDPFALVCLRGANTCTGTNKNGESWHLKVTMQGADQ